MKCYMSISHWSPTEYFDMLDVCVYSCLKNTDYIPNILCDEPCERVEKWKNKGVNVIYYRGDVFAAFIEQFGNDERLRGIAATYLRSNIPIVELIESYVLYVDVDTMFLNNNKFKMNLPKYIACAPEFNPNDWSYFNAGVLIINVQNMKNEHKKFVDFTVPNFEKLFKMAHDQGVYNMLYRNAWDRLPIELNYKPYWPMNDKAKIIHWHGVKPNNARDFFNGTMNNIKIDVSDQGTELYTRLINSNIDGYKKYLQMWDGYLKEAQL